MLGNTERAELAKSKIDQICRDYGVTYEGTYLNAHTKLTFTCSRGHVTTKGTQPLLTTGTFPCRKCDHEDRTITHKQHRKVVRKLHGKSFKVRGTYTHSMKHIEYYCKKCKTSQVRIPATIARGFGCNVCSNPLKSGGYSKMAVAWLEEQAKLRGTKIQHAGNIGEYRIPNTRMRVDGYCRKTNTVFEFHGDDWHGNPNKWPRKVWKKVKPNCFSDKTAKQLYKKTIKRENLIRKLGYNLVVIWQMEYQGRLA